MTLPVPLLVIPQTVLDAALELHRQKNIDLIFSPFVAEVAPGGSDPLWRCGNGEIAFVNLAARNQCAALAVYQQVMPIDSVDELFKAAHGLWRNEIGHPDSAAGRLLGFASQSVNVLLEAAKGLKTKQHHALDVFAVLHLLEVALPHLSQITANELVEVVNAQHESTKRDMAGGLIFNAIEKRLRTEPHLAWEISRIAKDNLSEAMQNLYSAALQSLMHTDQQSLALAKAREDADSISPLIVTAALWTLGVTIHTHQLNGNELDKCISVLTSKTVAADAETRQAAIRAVAYASLKDERLMSELVRLAAGHEDYTLGVIANFLFMNHERLPTSSLHFRTLLDSLVYLLPSQQSAVENFDWVLHNLYAMPENRHLVLNCLTRWLIHHGGSNPHDKALIELFDHTIMQIANEKVEFQALITRWLVAPEKQLAVACSGLISFLHIRGVKSPEFSSEVLNSFTSQDFKFLARRLLGYVISEEPLLLLTLSLLATNNAPERSFGWVYSLLTDEVGRDYAHATMEILKIRQETAISPEKELLVQIHDILLQRSTAMNDLPRLQELRPPMRLRRAITLNRSREMAQAMEEANEKSITRLIFTEIPIKAGRGWFAVADNNVGPAHHFQSFSHSVSLPKRSITDPVGYAIAGLYYRMARQEDE